MKNGWQYVQTNGTNEKMAPMTLMDNVLTSENGVSLKSVLPSNPNLLINGDFAIAQRGISGLSISTTSYLVDRWEYTRVAGAMHFWQEDVPADARAAGVVGRKVLHLQPNGSANFIINQWLETDLPPGNYTLSFFAKVDGGVPFIYGLFDDVRSATGNGQWTKYSETFNNSGHRNRIGIMRSNGVMPECTILLADAKLELGSIATPFVPRLYAEELAMCQRYYTTIVADKIGVGAPVGSSGTVYVTLPTPVTMRILPTINTNCSWNVRYNGSVYYPVSYTLDKLSDCTVRVPSLD